MLDGVESPAISQGRIGEPGSAFEDLRVGVIGDPAASASDAVSFCVGMITNDNSSKEWRTIRVFMEFGLQIVVDFSYNWVSRRLLLAVAMPTG